MEAVSDEAIRTFARGQNVLLLTDYGSFEQLKITCLLNYRVNQVSMSKLLKVTLQNLEKSLKICQKYNSTRSCVFSGGHCKYQHKCQKCSLLGHSEHG